MSPTPALLMFRVQAQLSCTTADGWSSSRQARTMDVVAKIGHDAVRAVSHLCWDMSGIRTVGDKHTFATVVEIDRRGTPIGEVRHVRVSYSPSKGIETVSGSKYSDVKLPE